MTLADHFRAMARNNLWSNYRLHQTCAALAPEEYSGERRAFFRSIHGALNHILLVDRYYLAMIAGEHAESGRLDREIHSDLPSLTVAQAAADRRLMALCDAFTPKRLARIVRWTDSDGGGCEDPVHVVLAHLFVHQIHHRGQVHDMLSQTPVAPPQLDEYFLSYDAPRRAADLEALALVPKPH